LRSRTVYRRVLVPFHGLSPVIKYLRVVFFILQFSHIFDLTLLFHLLEDLTVINDYDMPTKTDSSSDGLVIAA